MKVAFLAGTSGLVGMQLLHQCLKNKSYEYVISIGRRKLALKHKKLIQLTGDLQKVNSWEWEDLINAESLGGEYTDLTFQLGERIAHIDCFCSIGTTIKQAGSKDNFYAIDHDMVHQVALVAKKLGANQFLFVSALGADSSSSVFYNKVKGEIEELLKTVGFDYLGIFRPSLLLGDRKDSRFGEEIAKFFMKPLNWLKIWDNGRPIYEYQVAQSMVYKATQEMNSKEQVEIVTSGQMQHLSK